MPSGPPAPRGSDDFSSVAWTAAKPSSADGAVLWDRRRRSDSISCHTAFKQASNRFCKNSCDRDRCEPARCGYVSTGALKGTRGVGCPVPPKESAHDAGIIETALASVGCGGRG